MGLEEMRGKNGGKDGTLPKQQTRDLTSLFEPSKPNSLNNQLVPFWPNKENSLKPIEKEKLNLKGPYVHF